MEINHIYIMHFHSTDTDSKLFLSFLMKSLPRQVHWVPSWVVKRCLVGQFLCSCTVHAEINQKHSSGRACFGGPFITFYDYWIFIGDQNVRPGHWPWQKCTIQSHFLLRNSHNYRLALIETRRQIAIARLCFALDEIVMSRCRLAVTRLRNRDHGLGGSQMSVTF